MDCCCYSFLADVFFLSMAKRANEQQRGRIHSNVAAAKKRQWKNPFAL